jgi:hypothetical protein
MTCMTILHSGYTEIEVNDVKKQVVRRYHHPFIASLSWIKVIIQPNSCPPISGALSSTFQAIHFTQNQGQVIFGFGERQILYFTLCLLLMDKLDAKFFNRLKQHTLK